jgi:hypothetical protein
MVKYRRHTFVLALACFCVAIGAVRLGAWGSQIHSGIVHAAVGAVPPEDRIQERLGDEVWRLREYVQMGDWINNFVSVNEQWSIRSQIIEQPGIQFYASDYLIFPAMNHQFQHSVPDVKASYRPFFIRALQALRTESPDNAARWIGSLLHFITDSGSPPHTVGISGPDHTKMENWLDTSLIDLTGYTPRLLGEKPDVAVKGLDARMDGLIDFSAGRARTMLPASKADDRPTIERLALESAAETSRVTADVIHTLLRLSDDAGQSGASLVAEVTAPALEAMEGAPAKLVLLDTPYSTLSVAEPPGFHLYRGRFTLRGLSPGTYRAVIERTGATTLQFPIPIKAGQTLRTTWRMEPSVPAGNLVRNPTLDLHWCTPEAPDHWRYDVPRRQWISDNIPVIAGKKYRARVGAGAAPPEVELQWLAEFWQPMKVPAVEVKEEATAIPPDKAVYVRLAIKQVKNPAGAVRLLSLAAQ